MLAKVNTELLVAATGAAITIAGVLIAARGARRAGSTRRRTLGVLAGVGLILSGMFIAMWKYIAESGWGQWVESMMMWLVPALCSAALVLGAAVITWAMLADRSRGRKRCPRCWYDMEGTVGLVCPECGRDSRTPARMLRTRRHWRMASVGVLLALLGSVQFIMPWVRRGGYLPWVPTRVLLVMLPSFNSLHARAITELDHRIADPQATRSYFPLKLRPLAPMSESMRHALSRAAVGVLASDPKHPCRPLLFEFMPGYLVAADVAKAQPLVLGALSDPQPIVRLGALATLRRVDGFDPAACVPGVAALVSPTVTTPGLFNEERVLSEAVAYLSERGRKDPGAVPALVSLLRPAGARFSDWPRLRDEVLWALARMGKDAASASGTISGLINRSVGGDTDALAWYTLQMIQGKLGPRRHVLSVMLLRDEESLRLFAVAELGRETLDDGIRVDLAAAVHDSSIAVRVVAAAALFKLSKDRAATLALDQEVPAAAEHMALERIVDVFSRHELDLSQIESRVRPIAEGATGSWKLRLQQVLQMIQYHQSQGTAR